MALIKVKLSKLNNQSGQYEHLQTIEMDPGIFKRWAEHPSRCSVPGFYKYEGEVDGKILVIESVNPALFDHPEMHMT